MTHDDMELAIEFILRQRAEWPAKAEADIAALRTEQVQTEKHLNLANQAIVAGMVLVQKLAEAQTATEKRLDEVGQRLDAFIVVVEKYISRNNGHGSAPGASPA